jgi:hypothetical protein
MDAVYIDKKQLKLIKLKELLKKWDKQHLKQTFSCLLDWKTKCNDDNKQKYYNKLLSRLESNKGYQIKKNLLSYYMNVLNRVLPISTQKNSYGHWYCYINDSMGIVSLNEQTCFCEDGGVGFTFTKFKKVIKTKLLDSINTFMNKNNTDIAECLKNMYGEQIDTKYKLDYTVVKETENEPMSINFRENMF